MTNQIKKSTLIWSKGSKIPIITKQYKSEIEVNEKENSSK